ncbi:MAG: hypothetical protein J5589_00060 [Firmicutes bacterium]|nr:hypothetical protein [Bacillota bacterium]
MVDIRPIDEVIEALSICRNVDPYRVCRECPYPDTEGCMDMLMGDALFYLKEFRQAKETLEFEINRNRKEFEFYNTKWEECEKEKRRLEREIRIEKRLQEDYLRELNDDNPVLTLSELKQMVGKPVWIIFDKTGIGIQDGQEWFIVSGFYTDEDDCIMFCANYASFNCKYIGERWHAYRKEIR